ncbi:recombinase family protein [Streptomyces sp. NBC_00647]|uniref:recombinase family protein n=1 Tax=Streptomyces sp. NBC_00647 TaxID=2975796 RepID=UPI003868AB34
MTGATTAPGRQRATIQLCAEQLGFTLIGEASDFGVSARKTSPFDRPCLSPWLRRPHEYTAVMRSRVDRAVRSVAHMVELIAWGRQHDRTLVFGMPEPDRPLTLHPQADSGTIRLCMDADATDGTSSASAGHPERCPKCCAARH